MSKETSLKVDTKAKAYNLIHDPTILLELLYSKYGDIEEDCNLLYINQLVYDKSSHFNIFFKEYMLMNDTEDYLKRFYKNYETKTRIPKLSDYYKNYHLFFCRPNFNDLIISDIMENYGDDKAEIFYKKNFESTNGDKDSEKQNSESMSSLDNITDNKIIFTKKTKKIIDRDLDPNYGTLTLTNNSNLTGKINDGLISARSKNDSFEKIVHNLVYYKKSKKIYDKNKNKKIYQTKKNNNNNNILKNNKKIYCNTKHNNTNSNDNIISNKNKIDKNMKKINKNIAHISNINSNSISDNKNSRNKTSLFSLLKTNNLTNYTKTDNNINRNMNRIQNNLTITINLTKQKNNNQIKNNKNKNNYSNNALFSSPKISKEYISTKYEEFHSNLKGKNIPFYHKKNKTEYFNQSNNGVISNNNNNKQEKIVKNNYINKISTKKVNSRNYQDNLHNLNLNYRPNNKFNNFFTIGNNDIANKKSLTNNMIKNKTFEIENSNNEAINKITNLKGNLKIYKKNKINHHINNSNSNKKYLNNKIVIKKNYISNTLGSKFNLVKSPLKLSIINKLNIKKQPHDLNNKITSLNNFNKNANHKKSQTTILSNFLENSSKNNIYSPVNNNNKQHNKLYQINKSESIASKVRSKIENNNINNLNINFNNVIFNAPLTNINENINFNNNFINNTHFNTNYKLLTPTNNRNSFNNTFSNNNRISNNLVNIVNKNNTNVSNSNTVNNNRKIINSETIGKINYITNLKNYSNFSRNKMNSIDKYINNTEDIYSLIKSSEINQVKMINNTYTNLPNEKNEIFAKKKRELLISKDNNKRVNIKNTNKKTNQIKKPKKKIESRNKNLENGFENYGITQNINLGNKFIFGSGNFELIKNINDSFKTKDNRNNNYNSSMNYLYSSPNTDGRIIGIRPINVNRNSNLMSKKYIKYIKAKPKIKGK